MENNWYILKVVSGQENKISKLIESLSDQGKIFIDEVLVPTRKISKVKKGKKVEEQERLFSGYVFLKFDLNLDTKSNILSIPKVSSFLGGVNPTAVSKAKMDDIFAMINNEKSGIIDQDKIFEIGEVVNVIDGPFDSFSGVVEVFDDEKQSIKISISIFGRSTSVELNYDQVKK
ncbi:transcription termination/antitermination protein NusG [Rickettsiales bacterium]|nr:transcription termination/antitermination protein NusG [Rickettsiales bacterium]